MLAKIAARNRSFFSGILESFQEIILPNWVHRRPFRQSFGWDLREFQYFGLSLSPVFTGRKYPWPRYTTRTTQTKKCLLFFFSDDSIFLFRIPVIPQPFLQPKKGVPLSYLASTILYTVCGTKSGVTCRCIRLLL